LRNIGTALRGILQCLLARLGRLGRFRCDRGEKLSDVKIVGSEIQVLCVKADYDGGQKKYSDYHTRDSEISASRFKIGFYRI
jgi:hypothetical protein